MSWASQCVRRGSSLESFQHFMQISGSNFRLFVFVSTLNIWCAGISIPFNLFPQWKHIYSSSCEHFPHVRIPTFGDFVRLVRGSGNLRNNFNRNVLFVMNLASRPDSIHFRNFSRHQNRLKTHWTADAKHVSISFTWFFHFLTETFRSIFIVDSNESSSSQPQFWMAKS
jgi:hypothetical protein